MRGAAAALALALPLIAYTLTLCPTVYVGDSGEMVALAHTLGVAQPTGFPLYCLLGKIFTWLPFGTIAARVNFLSAVSLAVAGLASYRVAARYAHPVCALAGSLAFTLGHTAWSQATIARTYPLTLALTAVGLDLALTCAQRPGQRRFLALSLLAGLALGTHLLSLLLGPIVLYVWLREPLSRKLAAVALTCVGLSLYAYLPLRGPVTAYNAYGPLASAGQLADYLTQKRYAGKQWSRSSANLAEFRAILARRWATDQPAMPVFAPLALIGLAIAARRHRVLLGFLAVPALANLVILLGYGDDTDLPFLPRYFLYALFAQGVLIALGLEALRTRSRVAVLAVALALGWGVVANARLADRSRTLFPRDYATGLLDALPKDSLLFLAGDASTLMIDYLQYVEGFRRDVHCGEPETYQEHVAPLFARGQAPKMAVFANFLPAGLPATMRAVHTGLVWQILPAGQPPALDRAAFWRAHPFADLAGDAALSDYEAAAVAGEIELHRGLDRLALADPSAARDRFAAAARLSPENRLLFYNLARIFREQGWDAEARVHQARAESLDVTFRERGSAPPAPGP